MRPCPDHDESLLCQIVGLRDIGNQAAQKASHRLLMPIDQDVEGALRSALNLGDERPVVIAVIVHRGHRGIGRWLAR